MPKIVGTRERVHQPFYDSLIRVDGAVDLRTTNVAIGAFERRDPRVVYDLVEFDVPTDRQILAEGGPAAEAYAANGGDLGET